MRDAALGVWALSIATVAVPGMAIVAPALATSPKCVAAKLLDDDKLIKRHCKSDDDEPGTPRGSFVESCRNTRQDGWTVSARCKTKDGSWSQTRVNFKNCEGHSLTNLNGNLVCGP